ncbi:metallophosphoesterase, partial [Romeria aff. gracilis LEGE 07310]
MYTLLTGPLTIERLTIPIRGLPPALSGMTIAQLSDLHYDGVHLDDRMLADAIAAIHDLAPDLIVLTGDLVTEDPAPIYPLARRLKHLPSRYGTFAILGNHDIKVQGARETITHALERVDIPVLWNQIVYPLGPDFPVVGLADYWSREFKPGPVFNQLDPETPRLVLSHNPDTAEALRPWRVDLQLSGHTHGGQVYFPGLGSGPEVWKQIRQVIPKAIRNYIPYLSDNCVKVVRHWEWAMGLHQVGDNWLYVNRGLGTYLPGRFMCPPELTVITLERGGGRGKREEGRGKREEGRVMG